MRHSPLQRQRQSEIYALVAAGLAPARIAAELGIAATELACRFRPELANDGEALQREVDRYDRAVRQRPIPGSARLVALLRDPIGQLETRRAGALS